MNDPVPTADSQAATARGVHRGAAKHAIMLDRDGVLIEDRGPLACRTEIRLLPGVATALRGLKHDGWLLLVVSNQTVVARGLADEQSVQALQREVEHRICAQGGPELDGFFYCPHHPRATLSAYRVDCECRKPLPGLLRVASARFGLDLCRCVMVGDRSTDVLAGRLAGCRTVQVRSGRHQDPPIEVANGFDAALLEEQNRVPDHICADLAEAAEWIGKQAL